jgi:hypothetical protein
LTNTGTIVTHTLMAYFDELGSPPKRRAVVRALTHMPPKPRSTSSDGRGDVDGCSILPRKFGEGLAAHRVRSARQAAITVKATLFAAGAVVAVVLCLPAAALAQNWEDRIGLTPAQQEAVAAHEALARDPNDTSERIAAESVETQVGEEAAQRQEKLENLQREHDLDAVGLGIR